MGAGRRTNLAILALVPFAFLTGVLAFAIGTPPVRWIVLVHGLLGLALVLLAPWKTVIARRGLRRARPGSAAGVLLAVLVAVAIATGVLHSTGLAISLGPASSMQVHVGAALLTTLLALWHVIVRPTRPHRSDLSRRNLLRAGGLAAGTGLVYLALEGVLSAARLPGAERRFTGSHETGSSEPEAMPITQWLDDAVPTVDPDVWRLEVLVGGELVGTWTLDELAGFADRRVAVLDCTGGWFAEQAWEGVRLDRLLPTTAEGRSIGVGSVTGYGRRFPIADAEDLLLATRAGGGPLSTGHGFPARIVAPGRRGFWWVKWVDRVEVSAIPWWWQAPFPLT